jgi:hypothetical protein
VKEENTMKNTCFLFASAAAVVLGGSAIVGCSGDDTKAAPAPADASVDSTTPVHDGGATDSGATDSGTADADAGIPAPPSLGTQIDRFGRPAINTALNHSFDPDVDAAGAAKDLYNADNSPDAATWVARYTPEFEKNLAILDSLDTTDAGSGCGNQIFAGPLDAGAGRYATLASVLADDRLWINTAATSCTQYLGVELIATGVLPSDGGPDGSPTNECGGRKLTFDVIDTTYSAAAVGALSGVTDGINAVPAKTSGTTFPYLAPPQ